MWLFDEALSEESTTPDMLLIDGVNDVVSVSNINNFNVGEGDFTLTWRGAVLTSTAGKRLVAKLTTGSSGTGIGIYLDGASNIAGIMRVAGDGGTLRSLNSTVNGVTGTMTSVVFLRRGGSAAANRQADSYELWIGGVKRAVTANFTTLPTADVDNTTAFGIGVTSGSGVFCAVSETQFYHRALHPDEILGMEYGIAPEVEQVRGIWSMANMVGTSVPDISPNNANGVATGYTAAETEAATNTVLFKGNTSFVLSPSVTTLTKTVERTATVRRVRLVNFPVMPTITYRVLNEVGATVASGTIPAGESIQNVSFSVQAGQQLEVTVDITSGYTRIISFIE
jgi:hypothetical protein